MTTTPTTASCTYADFRAAKLRTIEAMRTKGGGFVAALAAALAAADPTNTERLYRAFHDVLAPYAPGGRFH